MSDEAKHPTVADRPHLITIILTSIAVAATLVSAWFSSQAFLLNRDFNIAGQQAYLTVKEPKLEPIGSNTRDMLFTIEVYNGGNTPAYNVSLNQFIDFGTLDEDKEGRYKQFTLVDFIGPKDTLLVKQPFRPPAEALVDKQHLFLATFHGELSYNSQFDEHYQMLKWCKHYARTEGFGACSLGYLAPIK
jgi:hypothetical protein